MKTDPTNELINDWLSLTHITERISNMLEKALQENYNLSLKEFYVLYFLSKESNKTLRLQQLQERVGLSQSAISRLVGRLEAKNCRALQRNVCEDDRRGVYTQLTELGEEKLQRYLVTMNEILQSAFSDGKFDEALQLLVQKK
ncbi:MarR family transcriptional regulator [Brevibacillus antibioticus]|uniref:MarR family transcriptional regulator n=1 Tax=Brevibacillus antibioticus TaxID=2570228 RepID=A0A4U2Y8C6_9BACL|nr:MarR family transcriptional regulator [Brevibacillus antibioticus]TKI55541.1 MarR family transcriptional regulator [Brevibacillus antibioticus]